MKAVGVSPTEFFLAIYWLGKLGLKAFAKALSVMFDLTDWGRLDSVFHLRSSR